MYVVVSNRCIERASTARELRLSRLIDGALSFGARSSTITPTALLVRHLVGERESLAVRAYCGLIPVQSSDILEIKSICAPSCHRSGRS